MEEPFKSLKKCIVIHRLLLREEKKIGIAYLNRRNRNGFPFDVEKHCIKDSVEKLKKQEGVPDNNTK